MQNAFRVFFHTVWHRKLRLMGSGCSACANSFLSACNWLRWWSKIDPPKKTVHTPKYHKILIRSSPLLLATTNNPPLKIRLGSFVVAYFDDLIIKQHMSDKTDLKFSKKKTLKPAWNLGLRAFYTISWNALCKTSMWTSRCSPPDSPSSVQVWGFSVWTSTVLAWVKMT